MPWERSMRIKIYEKSANYLESKWYGGNGLRKDMVSVGIVPK